MEKSETTTRIRTSLLDLQILYDKGTKKPLEDLMRAWKGIKELPYDNPNSFFIFGGYHGLPFRGEGASDPSYWGGYCNHGNVLFPTWHRVYLLKLEDALRSITGCENVTLPYWDETDDYSLQNGLPWPLTVEKFNLDGEEIDNPLRSFVLPVGLVDNIQGNDGLTKPPGYETKRYPLAATVGTEEDRLKTDEHNKKYPDYDKNVQLLNENIKAWLNDQVLGEFKNCLEAPNYTVFSNTTSAQQYNTDNPGTAKLIPLESPHNHVHLAVGGFEAPKGYKSPQLINGASGDMGENETAGFDPAFFFHHCNIDRMFWVWQKKYKLTDKLDVIVGYPGTNSSDAQGPTPGFKPNTPLDLSTSLIPFTKSDGSYFDSNDCVNVEKQLNYTYTIGSLDSENISEAKTLKVSNEKVTKVRITNLRRDQIKGSFTIEGYLPVSKDDVRLLGVVSVLSRWNLKVCSNCQYNLDVKAFFDIPKIPGLEDPKPFVKIVSRFGDTKREDHLLKATPEIFVVKNVEKNLVYDLI